MCIRDSTTHYIEEAEAIADRIAVISKGEILLVEETASLMQRMGQKEMTIELQTPIDAVPDTLARFNLIHEMPDRLIYRYDTNAERTGIASLLAGFSAAGLTLRDVQTKQSSLEDIFVALVKEDAA